MIAPIRISPTVKLMAIVCFVGFIVQQSVDRFAGGNLQGFFGLVPAAFMNQGYLWQLFTYPFMHGDPLHLFLNLMMLVFIGSDLEYLWGRRKFILFYFFCSSFAGVLYLLLQLWVYGGDGLFTPMVGASGAIYGLLMAYGILFGERVMLFMMLFPMKAKHFIWILALVEFMTTVFSGRSGLSSAAHIGGMVAGLGFVWTERQTKLRGTMNQLFSATKNAKKPAKKGHLKLVSNKKSDDDRNDDPKTWH